MRHTRLSAWSKRADRKIPQPQIGEAALLPHPKQRPVQREPHRIVALAHGDANAFAEIAAVEIAPAAKRAAILRIGAVEPERQRAGVAGKKVHVTSPQRQPPHVRDWTRTPP